MDTSFSNIRKTVNMAEDSRAAYKKYWQKYYPDGEADLFDDQYENSPEYIDFEEKSKELENFLMSLEYSQILDIEALMLLGRGDGPDFDSCRKYLSDTFSNGEKFPAVDYLVSKGPLGQYLEKGLQKLG